MRLSLLQLSGLLLCWMSMLSCGGRDEHSGDNAVYYWRTTFSLSDAERDYLKRFDVNRLYVRFFDVDWAWDDNSESVKPEATIRFVDTVPDGIKVVPTVYITNFAMEKMQLREREYADKIYKRVCAICMGNGIAFDEIQLDCDWTRSTRDYYYALCGEMKHRMDSTQSLSSTIRLHQLVHDPPPVDKGVLMVYNTGNLRAVSTENSIFSKTDIKPYLQDDRLSKYNLPLDLAYPTFGWSLAFYPRGDSYEFYRIMRRTDFSDYPQIEKIDGNWYQANSDVEFVSDSDTHDGVMCGYRIRVEWPDASDIIEIKEIIDRQLDGKPHRNILYHLDETQFSHYSDNEIDKIYLRN